MQLPEQESNAQPLATGSECWNMHLGLDVYTIDVDYHTLVTDQSSPICHLVFFTFFYFYFFLYFYCYYMYKITILNDFPYQALPKCSKITKNISNPVTKYTKSLLHF